MTRAVDLAASESHAADRTVRWPGDDVHRALAARPGLARLVSHQEPGTSLGIFLLTLAAMMLALSAGALRSKPLM